MKARISVCVVAGLCFAAGASASANQPVHSGTRMYWARDAASRMQALSRQIGSTFGQSFRSGIMGGRGSGMLPLTVRDITGGGSARGRTAAPRSGRHVTGAHGRTASRDRHISR